MKLLKYSPFRFFLLLLFALPLTAGQTASAQDEHLVEIDIVLPTGQAQRSLEMAGGDTLDLQGLPFPLQMLNGSELYLPEEAVVEDIRIEIGLPDFSVISEQAPQEVGFGPNIANAVEFNVYVDDELVSPYEFEVPVELTLPVPENLPENVGTNVSNFVLAYTKDGDSFDTKGIATTVQDTVQGIVKAEVEHFSNIAMTSEAEATFADETLQEKPVNVRLEQNYPNPFNPTTSIRFEIPERAEVRLRVYNTLGQVVATLKESVLNAGSHQVTWDATEYSSGVYLYRLEVDGQAQSRQMTLIK